MISLRLKISSRPSSSQTSLSLWSLLPFSFLNKSPIDGKMLNLPMVKSLRFLKRGNSRLLKSYWPSICSTLIKSVRRFVNIWIWEKVWLASLRISFEINRRCFRETSSLFDWLFGWILNAFKSEKLLTIYNSCMWNSVIHVNKTYSSNSFFTLNHK